MLPSKGDSKHEARFATRIDVLSERVDTLAATVATTASAIAKKDGEIASLRRDLHARDDALQALAAQAQLASQTPAGGPGVDSTELRSLKNAFAAMTKERAQSASASHVADLAARVAFLGQRLEALSTTVSTTAAGAAADPSVKQRVAMLEVELASLKAQAEQRSAEPDRPSEELNTMLATLRSQVEALGDLRSGVSEEQLDERVAETDGALTQLSGRLDALAESVESAAAGLGDEEHELVALHRHFTESSARIESIVEDIREALSAFPEPGSSTADELVARVERIEKATREAADGRERSTGELARRIDVIDQRVATVATEVARTKTLWPVALRSLEARLDDVSHVRRPEASADDEGAQLTTEAPADDSDDLLAGLRDSLHAMETVAAEMARASDALTPPEAEGDGSDALDAPVAAAGATIVPLRTGEL